MGKKLIVAWVSMGLLILLTGYLATYQEEIRVNLDRIARTHANLSLIYDLQNNLAEAEAQVKDFIITGDARHLQTYAQTTQEIERILWELSELMVDEPEQRRLLESLKPLNAKRLGLVAQINALRLEKGFDADQHPGLTREENKIRNSMTKVLDKIEAQEKRHLNPEWARQRRQAKFWLVSLTVGMFITFSILLIVLYLLNKEAFQRQKAEKQLASYQADLRSLASEATLAEERERRRLAVHLHDQIGQTLALSHIKLEDLRTALSPEITPAQAGELAHISSLLRQAIKDTQSLTFKISSPILYELGLEAALEWLTDEFSHQHGLITYFESDRQPKQLSEDLRVLAFQAVQELLVNVVKHAQARHLNVSLWREGDTLRIAVADDGVGFNPKPSGQRRRKGGGFGLFSIGERLRPLGGSLEVKSEPGLGAEVTLSVPLHLEEIKEKEL
jgi:signal transduction histidine kinase